MSDEGCEKCRGLVPPPGARCRTCGRQGKPLGHRCHAKGCTVSTKPEMLMCLKHWRMVPRDIQRRVWATYRPGQCDDKLPTEAWHQAADAAIEAVRAKEVLPKEGG